LKISANNLLALAVRAPIGFPTLFQADPTTGVVLTMPGTLSLGYYFSDYDLCPNGDVIAFAGRVDRVSFYQSRNANLATGVQRNVSKVHWSSFDDTVYYVNVTTGNIEKLIGSSF
jgi:hypothetical protein